MGASLRNPEVFFSVAEILDPEVPKDPAGPKFISGPDPEGNRVFIKAKQITDAVQLWEVDILDPEGKPKGNVNLVLGRDGIIKKTNGVIDIEDAKGDRFVIGSKLAAAIYHKGN